MCHIVRSATVNDGSPLSRCVADPGWPYSRSDLGVSVPDHVRPYEAVVKRSLVGIKQWASGRLLSRAVGHAWASVSVNLPYRAISAGHRRHRSRYRDALENRRGSDVSVGSNPTPTAGERPLTR